MAILQEQFYKKYKYNFTTIITFGQQIDLAKVKKFLPQTFAFL